MIYLNETEMSVSIYLLKKIMVYLQSYNSQVLLRIDFVLQRKTLRSVDLSQVN